MRWPFACCGLGYVWPLFIPPPYCIPLHSHQRSEAVQRCPPGPLSLAKSLPPGGGLLFSGGLRVAPFSVLRGSAQGTWMKALPCPERLQLV